MYSHIPRTRKRRRARNISYPNARLTARTTCVAIPKRLKRGMYSVAKKLMNSHVIRRGLSMTRKTTASVLVLSTMSLRVQLLSFVEFSKLFMLIIRWDIM